MVLKIKFTTIEQRIINGNILLEYQKLLLRKREDGKLVIDQN